MRHRRASAEQIEVNGEARHPLYQALVETPNEKGVDGDITWNFEKFLVDGDGHVVARFNPGVEPEDERLTAAVEALLA